EILKSFKEKGTIILEDNTHRILNDSSYSSHADYTIASLRKWFPIATGGYLTKANSKLNIKPNVKSNKVVEEKFSAMKLKTEYLNGKDIDKRNILKKMSAFENEFNERDFKYKIDDVSLSILETLDINLIRDKRRNNAQVLYNRIKDLKHINLL